MAENETLYRCAVVECKTDGCLTNDNPTLLVLQVIGEHSREQGFQIDILASPCRAFLFECPGCNQSHTYSRADVQVRLLVNVPAPIGWCSEEFAAATAAEEPETE